MSNTKLNAYKMFNEVEENIKERIEVWIVFMPAKFITFNWKQWVEVFEIEKI